MAIRCWLSAVRFWWYALDFHKILPFTIYNLFSLFNTKVIGLLRRFSGSEHKLFLKFLQSPYFNTNANVVELYRYLHKYAPDYTHVNVHRERVFAHLFGNEAFKDIKIRQFATLLADLIEQFWAIEQWRKQPLQAQLHLASAFLQHGLDTHLNDTLAHIEQSDKLGQWA